MNRIRSKIIAFWLLFLVFCLLLSFSWQHRLLWIALFIPAWMIIGLLKPRFPAPPKYTKLLFRVGLILMLIAVVVHALQPSSASLLLVAKIFCALFVIPRLSYQAYRDYHTLNQQLTSCKGP